MKKIIAVVLILWISTIQLFAQTQRVYANNLNSWFIYNGDHKISNKWGVHLETQIRRNDFFLNSQQLLLRAGVNYHINSNVFLTAGYCFVNTYPYGEFPSKATFPENRLWEQIQLKSQFAKFENINRIRLEQRFVNVPVLQNKNYVPGSEIYSNRIRYMTKFSLPLNKKTIDKASVYVTTFDEIFISFGENVGQNIFDQNRAFIGVGYKLPTIGKLEMGYLNQLLFKPDNIRVENNHTILMAFNANFNFLKQKK